MFHEWVSLRDKRELKIKYTKLFVIELTLDEFFRPISRDGASYIEIILTLLESLQSMAKINKEDSELIRVTNKFIEIVFTRGLQCLKFNGDKDLLRNCYALG